MFFSAEWSLGKVNQIPCICICFYLYLYSFSVCISLFRFWKSEQVALARRDLSRVLRCPAWGFPLQTDTHILLSLYPGACQGIRSSRNKVGYIWQGVVWIRWKGANGQNINYKAHNATSPFPPTPASLPSSSCVNPSRWRRRAAPRSNRLTPPSSSPDMIFVKKFTRPAFLGPKFYTKSS